ncbi:MAG: glycoside hydrolase family 97 protein [Sedimentisphaerales bacterium]|nr:glycoside hydrolase family 97 protein [Sedimentisphaerales bacterium]
MAKYKYVALFCVMGVLANAVSFGEDYDVVSPDKALRLKVTVNEKIHYSVSHQSKVLVEPSAISLKLSSGTVLGVNPQVRQVKRREVDEKIFPVVQVKRRKILDQFNELALEFEGGFGLICRAYNDGVAYRFVTDLDGEIKVVMEEATFNFPGDYGVYFPEEESFQTHSEREYKYYSLSEIKEGMMCSLPALVDVKEGPKVLITEADLEDYAGLYLRGAGSRSLYGKFPAYALAERAENDRDVPVTKRADFIAKTNGKRSFPWRVMIVAKKDGDLIESELVYKLAKPLQLKDTSWIKPGKVAWDWWNFNNVYGVDFRAGVNTETYKYYIDFAARYGLEYIILDEGWYVLGDLTKVVDGMDMEELFRYAKSKNVGIIPWVIWKTLDDQLDVAMDQFEKWGAKGLKVDFMQRDDQWMVNYYHKIAKEGAKRHMLIDFHGSYKPTGLRRTYPNVITREGVRGLENCKWGTAANPEHDVVIPFIRMVAGPMDYTPGAMNNAQWKNFNAVFNRPMSLGTRCHQLAMYVVYESPLQMLADTPTNYLKEPECMEFLAKVPTVWDETKVLDGKVADYVIIARKSGADWYVGAMTDWTARELTVDFSFLDPGRHTIDIYKDGINADRNGNDYKKVTARISSGDTLKIKLAPGGGWAAVIR